MAVVVIFLAGAGTGGALVRTFAPKVVKRTHVNPPLPVGHERRQEYIEKLDRELQLTAEQRTKIEGILAASQKRMKEIWEPMEPQVKEEYRRSRREISEVLTPDQQAKMKSWRKDRGEKKNDDQKIEKASTDEKAETQRKCSKDNCCL
jgi:Spy/CpxP family protein refolding chaperone